MIRLRERFRRAAAREDGFTLIEMLVVMLIIANLAAIALPAFINQKSKANDANAKETAHTTQLAMETCAVSSGGAYTGCSLTSLRSIAPTVPATGVTVETPVGGGYTLTVTATGGNTYSVTRGTTGQMSYPCTVASSNRGGCPGSGTTAGTWG